MLKDITLGQYFPGDTIVHRLDPRTKLICDLVYSGTVSGCELDSICHRDSCNGCIHDPLQNISEEDLLRAQANAVHNYSYRRTECFLY